MHLFRERSTEQPQSLPCITTPKQPNSPIHSVSPLFHPTPFAFPPIDPSPDTRVVKSATFTNPNSGPPRHAQISYRVRERSSAEKQSVGIRNDGEESEKSLKNELKEAQKRLNVHRKLQEYLRQKAQQDREKLELEMKLKTEAQEEEMKKEEKRRKRHEAIKAKLQNGT